MVIYMNQTATTTRTNLLDELRTRSAEGENTNEVLAELKARPEWELVARASNLR